MRDIDEGFIEALQRVSHRTLPAKYFILWLYYQFVMPLHSFWSLHFLVNFLQLSLRATWAALFSTGVHIFDFEQCWEVSETAGFSQTKKGTCHPPDIRGDCVTNLALAATSLTPSQPRPVHLFHTLSHFQSPPTPHHTPVWPFLLLCDWLEWTEDEAEEVLLRIQVPRTQQPPPLNVRPPVVFLAPILILSPCINRTDGAFSKLMWACATTATDSRILHRFTNDLTTRLCDAQLMSTLFQGCLVVFWPNQFSAVNCSTSTCLCMHALLGPGCQQVSRANPVFQIASKTSQLQNIARNGIVVLNCHKRLDHSYFLFLFGASGKGTDTTTMLRQEKYGRIQFSPWR